MTTMRGKRFVTPALPGLLYLVLAAAPAAADVRLLAETGRPAVGFDAGFVYSDLRNPVIGRNGHIAFLGTASGSSGGPPENRWAVWAGLPDSFDAIIRENDMLPGLPVNVVFEAVFDTSANPDLVISSSGYVGMRARLKGAVTPSVNNVAMLAHIDGVNEVVLRTGDPAPGFDPGETLPGENVSGSAPFPFAFSDAGMAILGQTTAGKQVLWFWNRQTGNAEVVAFSNQVIGPALPGCSYFLISTFSLNDAGTVAFQASSLGGGCPFNTIFKYEAGTVSKVVSQDDAVPGLPNTTFGGFLSAPRLNADGDISFTGPVRQTPPSAPVTINASWLARADGGLELLALGGEQVPGTASEFLVSGALALQAPPAGAGVSVITAGTTLGNSAVMAGPPRANPYGALPVSGESALDVVAKENDAAPGFPATWFFETIEPASIAGDGVIAFSGLAADALDVIGTKTPAIWRGTGSADLDLVAEPGIEVDMGDGSTGTLVSLFGLNESISEFGEGTQAGLGSHISAAGQLIFRGSTVGSSGGGIFITDSFFDAAAPAASQVPLPLPALAVTALALGAVGRRAVSSLRRDAPG